MKRDIALVLSGGGARGAYEAGVLAGLAEVLGGSLRPPFFDLLVGTSVGAINAAHVAAHAGDADQGIPDLLGLWRSLDLASHLRPHFARWARWSAADGDTAAWPHGRRWGRALLDVEPFDRLVQRSIPWPRLHENIASGRLGGLLVSAMNIGTGRTFTFCELEPGRKYVDSPDPRRASRSDEVTADHVLASAALPLLFPAQRIEGSFFCDGGLRFNTPIAPAIRAGAERLIIVALRAGQPGVDEDEALEQYPNPVFLLGKIFDALLLDPVDYDLQVLDRVNRLVEAVETTADADGLRRFHAALETSRGATYRRVRPLVFRPSRDLGVLARDYLRAQRSHCLLELDTLLLERAAALGTHVEADVLSYILFDGAFAHELIELGRRDVLDRAAEVEVFFRD